MSAHGQRSQGRMDFDEDPRYTVSQREMWISVAFWAVWTAAIVAVAWTLGAGEDATELEFVLGFPAWFFWSAIVCSVVFSIIPYFLVKYGFTDMPLTTDGKSMAESRDNAERD